MERQETSRSSGQHLEYRSRDLERKKHCKRDVARCEGRLNIGAFLSKGTSKKAAPNHVTSIITVAFKVSGHHPLSAVVRLAGTSDA
jgi:hypothetical protein